MKIIATVVALYTLLLLSGCAAVKNVQPPEYFREHTAQYVCQTDMILVCEQPGSRKFCRCR